MTFSIDMAKLQRENDRDFGITFEERAALDEADKYIKECVDEIFGLTRSHLAVLDIIKEHKEKKINGRVNNSQQ